MYKIFQKLIFFFCFVKKNSLKQTINEYFFPQPSFLSPFQSLVITFNLTVFKQDGDDDLFYPKEKQTFTQGVLWKGGGGGRKSRERVKKTMITEKENTSRKCISVRKLQWKLFFFFFFYSLFFYPHLLPKRIRYQITCSILSFYLRLCGFSPKHQFSDKTSLLIQLTMFDFQCRKSPLSSRGIYSAETKKKKKNVFTLVKTIEFELKPIFNFFFFFFFFFFYEKKFFFVNILGLKM